MKKGMHHRPFRHLKALLQARDIRLEDMPAMRLPNAKHKRMTPRQEDALFRQAMADVTPLAPAKTIPHHPRRAPARPCPTEEQEVVAQLHRLVESGWGYRVADTPEYIEGKGIAVPDEVVRRLHQGDFAVQGHLDLHGMGVKDARSALDHLLESAVQQGWRTLLIIHGRGLSSPDEPILKSRLAKWLKCGLWRRWVMAYASARPCDGGAGATYVLLRSRPVQKQKRSRPLPRPKSALRNAPPTPGGRDGA